MAIKVQDAGTLRTITGMQVKQSGITRQIKQVKVQDGGVLRTVATFADPLSITATSVAGEDNSSSVTTNPSFATAVGGFSPYTYAWTLLTNGGANGSTANSPTSAATTFTKTGLIPEQEATDTWRVTVTDAIGETATADISAGFTYLTGA